MRRTEDVSVKDRHHHIGQPAVLGNRRSFDSLMCCAGLRLLTGLGNRSWKRWVPSRCWVGRRRCWILRDINSGRGQGGALSASCFDSQHHSHKAGGRGSVVTPTPRDKGALSLLSVLKRNLPLKQKPHQLFSFVRFLDAERSRADAASQPFIVWSF